MDCARRRSGKCCRVCPRGNHASGADSFCCVRETELRLPGFFCPARQRSCRRISGAAAIGPGDLFAEAFACAHAVSPVSVLCKTDGSVLYLNVRAVFSPCEKACAQHKALSQNLIRVLAEKNMQLNEKAGFLSQRTTREKLLAYLSAQARRAGSASFRIPFDRQQLADFLSVNRSAMSAELSRMQREGLLCADRSSFTLCQPE